MKSIYIIVQMTEIKGGYIFAQGTKNHFDNLYSVGNALARQWSYPSPTFFTPAKLEFFS